MRLFNFNKKKQVPFGEEHANCSLEESNFSVPLFVAKSVCIRKSVKVRAKTEYVVGETQVQVDVTRLVRVVEAVKEKGRQDDAVKNAKVNKRCIERIFAKGGP